MEIDEIDATGVDPWFLLWTWMRMIATMTLYIVAVAVAVAVAVTVAVVSSFPQTMNFSSR